MPYPMAAARGKGGALPPWTPQVLGAGVIVGWYKADVGVYNDAGTTLATDGQTVRQWNDQSGNAWHLSQATAGSRPTYIAGVSGDVGSISFSNKFLEDTSIAWPNGAAAADIFVLFERQVGEFLFDIAGGGLGIYIPSASGGSGTIYMTALSIHGAATGMYEGIHEVVFDGSQSGNANRLNFYGNGRQITVGSFTGTVPATLQATNGVRVGNYSGGGFPWTGKIKEIIFCSSVLSVANRANMVAYLNRRNSQSTRKFCVTVGDSLTGGINSTTPYPVALAANLGTSWQVVNFGIGGARVQNWVTYQPLTTYPLLGAHAKNIEVVLLGVNDIIGGRTEGQIEGDLTTYWAARRAAGWKLVACTVFDGAGVNGTTRANVNTWILSQSSLWDAVADLAANANLSDHTNHTYFSAGDELHLTTAGYAVVSGLVQTAVQSL